MPTGVTVAVASRVMVGSFRKHPALASPRKRTDLDRRFGIDRESSHVFRLIRLSIPLLHLGEDGIGFGEFFWGWLLATFFG
jgi:hypothetical protein